MVSKRLRDVRKMASLVGSGLFEQEGKDWDIAGQEFYRKVENRLLNAGFQMVHGGKFTNERWRGPAPKNYERGVGRYSRDRRIERLKLLDIEIRKNTIGRNDVVVFYDVRIGPLSGGMDSKEDTGSMKKVSIDSPSSESDFENKKLLSSYDADLSKAYSFLDSEIRNVENENRKIEASNKKFAKGKKLVFPFSMNTEEKKSLRKAIVPCGCR